MSRSADEPSARPDDDAEGDPGRHDPTDAEIDRRFAELTAGLQMPSVEPETSRRTPRRDDEPTGHDADTDDEPVEPTLGGPRDYALAPEPDDGFVPPEPAPLDDVDRVSMLGWALGIGGPVLFVVLLLAWPTAPSLVWLTLLGVTLAGWGLALWRLPRHRNDDDDGAVV